MIMIIRSDIFITKTKTKMILKKTKILVFFGLNNSDI